MELVDIYNERHENLGYTKGRKELDEGEYRLSSFIWVMNDKEEILIQQRIANTKKFPNMWGTTAGGVIAGDSSLVSAIRELDEELGIQVNKENMTFIGSYKRINDFVEVWLCKKNIEIDELTLQEEEVQAAKWVSVDDFEKMIEEGTAIKSGYDIFKIYYKEFYNSHYELIDGKIVTVPNNKL